MNRLIKIIVLVILFLGVTRCKPLKNQIIFEQETTVNPIKARLTMIDSTIYGFKFPNKFKIKNNSSSEQSFVLIDYNYGDSLTKWRNLGIELYQLDKNQLKRIPNNSKRTISSRDSVDIIYYTRHFVDSLKTIQKQFKPYIEKMLQEKKDTLHIGTVSKFRKKHKELFEKLTKNDSISIQFLNNGQLGERITVPVKW